MDKSEFRNAEILNGPKDDRAVRDYGHAHGWINEVAEGGRDHPAFTTTGWWRPGHGGSRDRRVLTPWIVFDIDDEKGEMGRAYLQARDVIAELYRMGFGLRQMYASFSGKKGFHVRVSAGYLGMPYFEDASHGHETLKRFFRPLIAEYDVDTNPLSPLVVIRLTGSCHAETGARKWTMPARRFAKDPDGVRRMVDWYGPEGDTLPMEAVRRSADLISQFPHPSEAETDMDLAENFAEVWRTVLNEREDRSGKSYERAPSTNRYPMPEPMYRAFQGLSPSERFAVGHRGRDEGAFMLACHFLRKGHSPERTLDLLRKWDLSRNDPPMQEDPEEPSEPILRKVNSAIRKLHHDGEITEYVQI